MGRPNEASLSAVKTNVLPARPMLATTIAGFLRLRNLAILAFSFCLGTFSAFGSSIFVVYLRSKSLNSDRFNFASNVAARALIENRAL